MGVPSSAGPQQPDRARRSVRATFTAMVAVPVACLVLLWATAAGIMLGSALARRGPWSLGHHQLIDLTLLVGGGVAVILISLILMGVFARRVSRDVSGLAGAAQQFAGEQLPLLLDQLRGADQPAVPAGLSLSRPRPRTAEVAQAVGAVASLQRTAIAAAAGEASLRNGLRQVFVSLARRNQSLLQRQLRLIDALEQKAPDPAALSDLFALDHLTTRMRRHAESLAILSGAAPGRSWTQPVPVIDVIRGAMAEVEDYKRVSVLTAAEDAVLAPAVADMIHLLAELIENATMFSPSGTRVEIRAERVANGFAIEIDDRGLGIEPAQLAEINEQLARPPDFDLANADRLGLFVGAKLAARHGVRVSLRPSPYGGTSAIVLMPNTIVAGAAKPDAAAQLAARHAVAARAAGLDPGSPGTLALASRRTGALPPAAADRPAAALDNPDRLARTDGGPRRTLPRRTRQASLSPHLRGHTAAGRRAAAAATPAPADARTPEQARDLAASLQTGWQRGRQGDSPATQPAARPHGHGRQDFPGPDSEET
jgi:signal transduction histidine kinase